MLLLVRWLKIDEVLGRHRTDLTAPDSML